MRLKAMKSFASALVSPSVGDIVELDAKVAKELIDCGYLAEIKEKKKTTEEPKTEEKPKVTEEPKNETVGD